MFAQLFRVGNACKKIQKNQRNKLKKKTNKKVERLLDSVSDYTSIVQIIIEYSDHEKATYVNNVLKLHKLMENAKLDEKEWNYYNLKDWLLLLFNHKIPLFTNYENGRAPAVYSLYELLKPKQTEFKNHFQSLLRWPGNPFIFSYIFLFFVWFFLGNF